MLKHLRLLLFLIVCSAPCRPADLVFGRRVYSERIRTYQQIWTLDSQTGRTAALTSSSRRHVQPSCAPDGKRIWFLSGKFGDENNDTLWWLDPSTKKETLAATLGGAILRVWGGSGGRAFFLGLQGETAALYEWAGKLRKVSVVSAQAWEPVALAPDGKTLAVQTGNLAEVTMIEASGTRGRTIENCSGPVWSADMRKLACASGKSVRVIDLTTGIEVAHVDFSDRSTAPSVADFAPDGKRLLVRTVGANHNSTFPQSDYWTLELTGAKWTFIGPGQTAVFSSGGGVLLVTPRELSAIGKGQDWTSQLLFADPSSHTQKPLAAGRASNVEPCRCSMAATTAVQPVKSAIVSLKQMRRSASKPAKTQ